MFAEKSLSQLNYTTIFYNQEKKENHEERNNLQHENVKSCT